MKKIDFIQSDWIFASQREAFGTAMAELGAKNRRVFLLTADLKNSLQLDKFARKYPSRFINVGVAEQNLMGIAAGLAFNEKIPFVASYSVFNPGRNWDQFRVSVCYSKANVKVLGAHSGLSVGPDGATHQGLEDIAITRVLPNLAVLAPADGPQTELAVQEAMRHNGPVYIRIGRADVPTITKLKHGFKIGQAQILCQGKSATIISTGSMLGQALIANQVLTKSKIKTTVINLPTIKPLDEKSIIESAKSTGLVVTIEDHQVAGGMGSSVAELLGEKLPTRVIKIGVRDSFGESGSHEELYQKYNLNYQAIVKAVKTFKKNK